VGKLLVRFALTGFRLRKKERGEIGTSLQEFLEMEDLKNAIGRTLAAAHPLHGVLRKKNAGAFDFVIKTERKEGKHVRRRPQLAPSSPIR